MMKHFFISSNSQLIHSISRHAKLPALLLALVLLSGCGTSLVTRERVNKGKNTPGKSTVGYSGEQTVDKTTVSTTKGTDWFAEASITLNDTRGYKAHDQNWKSAETVQKMLAEANAKNTNMLLNIGPQPDGRFPAPAIAVLKELAEDKK